MVRGQSGASGETNDRGHVLVVGGERNFEGQAYFEVRSGPSKSLRVRRRILTLRVNDNGVERTIKQVWEVREGGDLGLPTALDQDVYIAVLSLIELRGGMPEGGEVEFSLSELIEILGWAHSGRSYERVRTSLDRMASTTIRCQRAWWGAATGAYISDTFALFALRLREEWAPVRHKELHAVKFHPLIVESYHQAHLTMLDAGYYWTLRSPVAKRMYRLLNARCARAWEVDVFELRDLVPLAAYKHVSQVERALYRAHEELVHGGYLDDVVVDRPRRGLPGVVRYEISSTFASRQRARIVAQDPASSRALTGLVREKVKRIKAIELVYEYGPQHCVKYLDLLPWQRGLRRDRAGALIWAIEHPDESAFWAEVADAQRAEGRTSKSTSDKPAKDGAARRREGYEWLFDR